MTSSSLHELRFGGKPQCWRAQALKGWSFAISMSFPCYLLVLEPRKSHRTILKISRAPLSVSQLFQSANGDYFTTPNDVPEIRRMTIIRFLVFVHIWPLRLPSNTATAAMSFTCPVRDSLRIFLKDSETVIWFESWFSFPPEQSRGNFHVMDWEPYDWIITTDFIMNYDWLWFEHVLQFFKLNKIHGVKRMFRINCINLLIYTFV